tara:strand:+ start:261 stop:740 length:480 start_codon:yes stop_codon:yes gene_type:complete
MKKLILIIAALFFASVAEAKITYNNSVMETGHLNTIKGLLYDTTRLQNNSKENEVSKAIIWLTDCHNSADTFKLEQINTSEAILIKNTITTIYDVLQGKFPGMPIEEAITHWTEIGTRVHAWNSTSAVWKLELRRTQSKTQNLVFRHAPSNTIVNLSPR